MVCIACFRSFLSHQLKKYTVPSKLEVNPNGWGAAVDWLNKQIYYCGNLSVMAYDMSIETTTQLFTTDSPCNYIAVDPYTR